MLWVLQQTVRKFCLRFQSLYSKQKWIATMHYAVIQKGQSVVHKNSEFEDTMVNSYINQVAKRWWLTQPLNDWDPYPIINGQSFLFWFVVLSSIFLVSSGKICRVGIAGPSPWETHLSDAAGMGALHGLNWKHPETHNSSGNQDVRQLPLGQGLGCQRIELHPHYPLVWIKRFMV